MGEGAQTQRSKRTNVTKENGRGLGGRGIAHPKAVGGGGGFGGWAVGAPPDADA